ncbi:MAG: 4-hydroxy-tetrahydrodipicolinate synthase [Acholeplasmatales bacterium]|jgi:4-hydroxy-tetrahydrodipicolinate synthase|nr:4-hydroxy-tetrahydrodipicolinate synthase [Acholeplasmatales bacterium]MCI9653571.1 4-hydroxy-tetrahydrodipicolinate synthase [Acholeplasmatales bacterium]
MLKGSFVALVTPFDQKGNIDYKRLEELIEFHIQNQTDGFVLLGTTAEAATMSLEEQKELVSFGLKQIHHRVPVIVGAGSNHTKQAVDKAILFSSLGADYILSITPYYNKTNERGLIAHFEAVADAAKCPVILYNVPSRTGMSISISAIESLAKHPNIIGIKEASGDISYAAKLMPYLTDEFVMLSGNDDCIVPLMSIGASGVISVLANICPQHTHKLCEYCLKDDFSSARELQKKLLPIANALFLETNPIPVKAAMNALGMDVGGYRLPLYDMDEGLKEKLMYILQEHKEMIY